MGIGVTVILVAVAAGASWCLPTPPWTRLLLAAAVVPASWLTLRAAPEIVLLAPLGWTTLMVVAGTTARGTRPWALGPRAVLLRVGSAVHGTLMAPLVVRDVVRTVAATGRHAGLARRLVPLVRGLALAVPLTILLVVLLRADAVFDAVVTALPTGLVPGDLAQRVVVAVAVSWVLAAVLGALTAPGQRPVPRPRGRLTPTEALMVLVPMIVVFAVFSAGQVVAAVGGATHILEQANLTYAEYAREGFAQLIAVSLITLSALTGLQVMVRRGPDGRVPARVTWASTVAVVLVLLIVGVALRRLDLYGDAFGLTRLRLWAMVATVWIGGVFLLLLVRLRGVGAPVDWLLPAATAWAGVLLLGIVAVGPDVVIVRANLDLARSGVRSLDVGYALGLSEDAIPTMVAATQDPRIPAPTATALREGLCAVGDRWDAEGAAQPWAGWNLSRWQAWNAVQRVC